MLVTRSSAPVATKQGRPDHQTYQESRPGLIDRLGTLFPGDHLNASGGEQYSDQNFGRDSAISATFLLDSLRYLTDQQTCRDTRCVIEQSLKSLIHWQGQKDSKIGGHWRKNAEEKGKIHHQAGPITIDELGLVGAWQDTDDAGSDILVYFGSVDSTALFVCTIARYIAELRRQDPSGHLAYSLLLENVPNFRGQSVKVVEGVIEATRWIEGRLETSDLGLLEYYRRPGQEGGLRNQVWKDSLTSYVHSNGELANSGRPIASIEVQAQAYDALIGVAEMFAADPILARSADISDNQIQTWQATAQALRQKIFKHFWMNDQQRFAQAIDRDPKDNKPRLVKTPSSNELHLLNSRLFDDLPQSDKELYIKSLVRQVISDDFLTDVGLRCRAKSAHQLINFADYHGSWVVWPWETHWIALGLRRQGLEKLADELDVRLLNAFAIAGCYREFFIADPRTDVCYYDFKPLDWVMENRVEVVPITATNIPDEPQTWSFTTAEDIRSILSFAQRKPASLPPWLKTLEQEALSAVKHALLLTDGQEISRLYQSTPIAAIDRVGGRTADARYYEITGGTRSSGT